jgi:uncharacterized protein (DUF302 family)
MYRKKFMSFRSIWWIFALLLSLALSGCGNDGKRSSFVIEKSSGYGIEESVKRFSSSLSGKNYHLASIYDHEKDALANESFLTPTLTIELNNPKISTKLIGCDHNLALELPIRVAIYNELNGTTRFAYTNPEYWSLKYNIKDKECLGLLMLISSDLKEASTAITGGKK